MARNMLFSSFLKVSPNRMSQHHAKLHKPRGLQCAAVIQRTALSDGAIVFKLFCILSFISVVSCNLNLYTIVQTPSQPYQVWQKRASNARITPVPYNTSYWNSRKWRQMDNFIAVPRDNRYSRHSLMQHPRRVWKPSLYQYDQTFESGGAPVIQSSLTPFERNIVQNRKKFNSFPPWYADKYRRYPRDPSDEPWTSNSGDVNPWSYQPKCRSCGRAMLQDSYCSDDIGLYVNNIPSVDSCSWKALWSHVTRQQKRHLKTRYRQLCGVCKIERVLRLDVQLHQSRDTCYVALAPNPNEIACRDRFSVCRYQRTTKTCAFNHRPLYDVCRKWFAYRAH